MIHPIKIKLVLGLENKKKEDRLVLSEDFFKNTKHEVSIIISIKCEM